MIIVLIMLYIFIVLFTLALCKAAGKKGNYRNKDKRKK